MILKESPQEIVDFAKLQTSKLKNMKDQLEILLRKKYRLELEIRSLQKAIKERSRFSEKSLKLKISAENALTEEPLTLQESYFLETEYPEIHQALKDYDSVQKDAIRYLESLIDEEF